MGQRATTSPAWLVFAAIVSLVGILCIAIPSTLKAVTNANTSAESAPLAQSTPEARPIAGVNDGKDPLRPQLAPADLRFIDKRGGWGWGDRCWNNIRAGNWGWARAECDKAMTINPASPQPMASLLYNQALIAIHMGNTEEAKGLLVRSLQLREHPEVRGVYQQLQ